MIYDDFLTLVKQRRSIRRFTPDPVSDSDIEKILEAARWAPSGFNSQLWEFVVVLDPPLKTRIAEVAGTAFSAMLKGASPDAPASTPENRMTFGWEGAPVFILLYGDTRVRAHSPVPAVRSSDAKWLSVFQSSLAIAFQYAALAATSLGLASQWVSIVSHPLVSGKIRETLGIPPELELYDMMALGHAGMDPTPKPMRPLSEIMHRDSCRPQDFRSPDAVKAFFKK